MPTKFSVSMEVCILQDALALANQSFQMAITELDRVAELNTAKSNEIAEFELGRCDAFSHTSSKLAKLIAHKIMQKE